MKRLVLPIAYVSFFGFVFVIFLNWPLDFGQVLSTLQKSPNLAQENSSTSKGTLECITRREVLVSGNSMFPLFESGQTITVAYGYYDCDNSIETGDVIVIKLEVREDNIVKRLVGKPGDSIQFKENRILVNGTEVKNSQGEQYFFNEETVIKLQEYFNEESLLASDFHFILSDNIDQRYDSRTFGPVFRHQIIGKVIIE